MSLGKLHMSSVISLGFIILGQTDKEYCGFAFLCKLRRFLDKSGIFLCLFD